MRIFPHNLRGWLQIYFTGVETALIGSALVIAVGFPHGVPGVLALAWDATLVLLILSTLRCLFYDRQIAITGIVTLGFVGLFRLPW